MKLLVLISILYSIADTECITHQWASNTAFLMISIYICIFFWTLSAIVLILYQPAGHDTVYYTYVHQCNNPLPVLSNANIHKAIKYKAKARAFKAKALSISRCRLWVFALKTWIQLFAFNKKTVKEVLHWSTESLVFQKIYVCLLEKNICLSSKWQWLMLTDAFSVSNAI